jgi:hypothetical protein
MNFAIKLKKKEKKEIFPIIVPNSCKNDRVRLEEKSTPRYHQHYVFFKSKFQEPNLQIPKKLQEPKSNFPNTCLAGWDLEFIWILVLASWNFS